MTPAEAIEVELMDERPIQEPAALVRYDPSDLLAKAIDKGLDITSLEKFMDLQERWEANRARAAFFEAKARFQSLVPEIPKEKQGYGYLYAPLGVIERAISRTLGECGLSKAWRQVEDGDNITMTCTITHVLGHSESSPIGPVKWDLLERTKQMNGLQHRAAVITILQRYTLISVLGLATADVDTDGEGGRDKKKEEKAPAPNVADQIRQPRKPAKINKEQAQEIAEVAASRGIPNAAASAILQGFGFAKGAEITVDKLEEIKTALTNWQPREPGDESEQKADVPAQTVLDKTAELRKKAEDLFLALAGAGKKDEAAEAIDKAAGVREIEHVIPGDLAAVIAGLEKLTSKKK